MWEYNWQKAKNTCGARFYWLLTIIGQDREVLSHPTTFAPMLIKYIKFSPAGYRVLLHVFFIYLIPQSRTTPFYLSKGSIPNCKLEILANRPDTSNF
jgi:hypothetical protein